MGADSDITITLNSTDIKRATEIQQPLDENWLGHLIISNEIEACFITPVVSSEKPDEVFQSDAEKATFTEKATSFASDHANLLKGKMDHDPDKFELHLEMDFFNLAEGFKNWANRGIEYLTRETQNPTSKYSQDQLDKAKHAYEVSLGVLERYLSL